MAETDGNVTIDNNNGTGSHNNHTYQKPQREFAKRKISELILQGFSNSEISQQLQISLKSIERYASQLYQDDNYRLQHPTDEQRATDVNAFRARLAVRIRKVEEIIDREEEDGQVKLNGIELINEMDWARTKLLYQPPEWVSRSFNVRSNPLVESQQGLEIKLVTTEEEQEQKE